MAERLTLPAVLVHFFRFARNLQMITSRAAREGARERVCFAQKQPIAATAGCVVGSPLDVVIDVAEVNWGKNSLFLYSCPQ